MAVKKSDLYSTLWDGANKLRGGMDASQYKDYVLVLLFMKYVSDRASMPGSLAEVPQDASFRALVQLKGRTNIGEEVNKVIGRLAAANHLQGVIDVADFDDESKLGRGQDKVDRLSNLIGIFQNPALDFSGNRADGDDLLGDAYEFLMRKFATESGKSKGQFYTPAEVSRIMASVIGVDKATNQTQSIHDPTCGSGALLLKAHDAAKSATGLDLAIYGQEMDQATAGLAQMNMWLHNVVTAEIKNDNTLSRPQFKNTSGAGLKTFDFVVANPPFSTKDWSLGLTPSADPYGRFDLGVPPAKNGDYAFLLHVLACLKSTGKGAIILPHGVLFRGNSEGSIRREIIKRHYIKGIIGLPANLFYGTGIPACIIVLDKQGAALREAIFMIDASRGFEKDGAKNRLRERDVHRIVDVFSNQIEIPGYSRLVPISEIAEPQNDYNLNLPSYIDSSGPEDVQDLGAHLRGGIPNSDLDGLSEFWSEFENLRLDLFEDAQQPGYSLTRVRIESVYQTVLNSPDFLSLKSTVLQGLAHWIEVTGPSLRNLNTETRPKVLSAGIAEALLQQFADTPLVDPYAVYQGFMSFWNHTMSDDIYLVADIGWLAAALPSLLAAGSKERVDFTVAQDKFKSELIPSALLIDRYFADEASSNMKLSRSLAAVSAEIEELLEEHGQEDGVLSELIVDGSRPSKADVTRRIRALGDLEDPDDEDAREVGVLAQLAELLVTESDTKTALRIANNELNAKLAAKYGELAIDEIKDIVVSDKWIPAVVVAVEAEITRVARAVSDRVHELSTRYETPLPELMAQSSALDLSVEQCLTKMVGPWR
jgi:type I restriction enzyme M protein